MTPLDQRAGSNSCHAPLIQAKNKKLNSSPKKKTLEEQNPSQTTPESEELPTVYQ